jgi:very-short-patch-repair endonuclease
MPARNIVIGQRVQPDKVQRAKELRRKMMPTENILWQKLRANRLGGYHFRRQQVIAGFIVDFYCHAVGLIVEVDGGIHQTRTEYDQARDRILSARGLRVIRIPNADISRDLPSVLNRILAACQATQ